MLGVSLMVGVALGKGVEVGRGVAVALGTDVSVGRGVAVGGGGGGGGAVWVSVGGGVAVGVSAGRMDESPQQAETRKMTDTVRKRRFMRNPPGNQDYGLSISQVEGDDGTLTILMGGK